MSILDKFAFIAVYAPFIGFLLCMLFVKTRTAGISSTIFCMGVALTATFFLLMKGGGDYSTSLILFDWIHIKGFHVNWGLKVDPLVTIMLCVVNSISFLVHVYSLGYMAHDPSKTRFMGYLSFFTFMMLALVTSPNMVQLFLGWEGVGLASYLLISFWQERPSAGIAATKAFVVNRVGDAGLIVGMAFLLSLFGTLDFDQIAYMIHVNTGTTLPSPYFFSTFDWVCLCLIIGAMGKSAQFGLHIWLPDAMEGPTPVSALIHAATMVTAGIFLIARLYFLFDLAPHMKEFLIWLGIFTAFFAGTVALVQNDIKRIIAYSTCSQLGYMIAACGAGAYKAAMFHLATHAFFKALLFLSAGSVIHAMSDEQDITKMGGIRQFIPHTYLFMWIGTLALIGMPFFAGYYSKDAILNALFESHHMVAYGIGLLVVSFTSFYSLRLIFMVFHGKINANERVMAHIHESPQSMLAPLGILSVGAILSGYLGKQLFSNNTVFNWKHTLGIQKTTEHLPIIVELLPVIFMLLGCIMAYKLYMKPSEIKKTSSSLCQNKIYLFLQKKWMIDELYDVLFVKPCQRLAHFIWTVCDLKLIDRFGPDGLAKLSLRLSNAYHKIQTGYVYHYALIMIIGFWALSAFLVYIVFIAERA